MIVECLNPGEWLATGRLCGRLKMGTGETRQEALAHLYDLFVQEMEEPVDLTSVRDWRWTDLTQRPDGGWQGSLTGRFGAVRHNGANKPKTTG